MPATIRRLCLPSFLVLLLASSACTSPPDAAAGVDAGGGDGDLNYGGGSVIPSFSEGGGGAPGAGSNDDDDGGSLVPCPRDASADAAIDGPKEASLEGAATDAACGAPLGPGDLAIDEMMIASQSGDGDHGEWLEIQSTRDCAVDLDGLYAEVPHGQGVTLATIASHVLLPPRGFFLVADSTEASENHDLPGMVVPWGTGTGSDVLLNSGDTIVLYTASATIDSLTYPDPSMLVDGASMAFPADCAPSLRGVFGNWRPSVASWTAGFFGTPARSNADVHCPVAPPTPPSTSPCGG